MEVVTRIRPFIPLSVLMALTFGLTVLLDVLNASGEVAGLVIVLLVVAGGWMAGNLAHALYGDSQPHRQR